ncbi:hypothetical protein PsorP6_011294 [Peronosclerospora sorghi]|uniref:Uncharacterized protein n=1 Tax=Peronosclerospora sorghi TaxID=230839 RepID=A0ACC0WM48_9STRA|nr:hypothetical protein PsorP6_011294 [Peronosclerospora sorghi]
MMDSGHGRLPNVVLIEKEYLNWSARFKEANASLEEIDERKHGHPNEIDKLMTGIERDLELLGATAIENKL